MYWNARIEKTADKYTLVIDSKNHASPLLSVIQSINLAGLKITNTAYKNATIPFYLNFLSLENFQIDESNLYKKNPDAEGFHKKKMEEVLQLNRFTCLNPQEKYVPSYAPILHVSSLDLFSETSQASHVAIIPRYIKYIDSSIWNYYVPYQRKDHDRTFRERFLIALSEIIDNTLYGVYNINNAREYADLHARQAKQSYMSGVGAHTKNVSPYLFHSEYDMEKLVEPVEGTSESPFHKIDHFLKENNFRWRLLIIDDFAIEHLKTYPKGGSQLTKTDIIVHILTKRFGLKCRASAADPSVLHLYQVQNAKLVNYFLIERAQTITEAATKLKEKCYDIILLDYLLKYKDSTRREYSYELLDLIMTESDIQKMAAPFRKFWIFHISSFRSAIQERLQEKGHTYDNNYWHIGQGACPLNTPRLFEYRLYSFMYKQIDTLSVPTSYQDPGQIKIFTITQLLDYLMFSPDLSNKMNTASEFTKRMRHNFQTLLQLKEIYKKLHIEMEIFRSRNQSELINSIYMDMRGYNNAFWEHLIHLAHLIAYGSAPQWNEMSEELYFLKNDLPEGALKRIAQHIEELKKIYK